LEANPLRSSAFLKDLSTDDNPTLSINALHFTDDDLYCASQQANYYPFMLPQRDTTTLHIDLHQRGLGGDESWGALPHQQFRIDAWPMSYAFVIQILDGGK
jgi:beta-galactosidase